MPENQFSISKQRACNFLALTDFAENRKMIGFLTGVFFIGRFTPTIICGVLILSSPTFAMAGPFFGATNDTFGSIVRNVAEYLRNILFVVGFIGLAIGAIQKQFMPQTPYGKTIISAGICFGLSAIAQIIFGFANNQQVTFDSTLTGN